MICIPSVREVHTLIQDQDLASPDNGSRKGQNLALPDGQVTASTRDSGVQSNPIIVVFALKGGQARCTKRVVQLGIIAF